MSDKEKEYLVKQIKNLKKVIEQKDLLIKNLNNEVENSKTSKNNKCVFTCDHCDKDFEFKTELYIHKEEVHEDLNLKRKNKVLLSNNTELSNNNHNS